MVLRVHLQMPIERLRIFLLGPRKILQRRRLLLSGSRRARRLEAVRVHQRLRRIRVRVCARSRRPGAFHRPQCLGRGVSVLGERRELSLEYTDTVGACTGIPVVPTYR